MVLVDGMVLVLVLVLVLGLRRSPALVPIVRRSPALVPMVRMPMSARAVLGLQMVQAFLAHQAKSMVRIPAMELELVLDLRRDVDVADRMMALALDLEIVLAVAWIQLDEMLLRSSARHI